MYAMLVLRGPQGRLVIPTESPSLNKVFTYLLTYLLTYNYAQKRPQVKTHLMGPTTPRNQLHFEKINFFFTKSAPINIA